jgi:hypothetical protein
VNGETMGSKQSVLIVNGETFAEEEDSDDQKCCFFPIGKPSTKSAKPDPTKAYMGTPILTPVHERRKRDRIMEEARQNPVMMSQYGGLEKETAAFYRSDLLIPKQNGAVAASSVASRAKAAGNHRSEPGLYEDKVGAD